MQLKIVKTMLYAYPHLEALADAEEIAACNKAILSFRNPSGVLRQAEEVAENVLVARRLRILREEIFTVMARLSEDEKLLLEAVYFRNRKAAVAYSAACAKYCGRTSYRNRKRVLSRMEAELRAIGWTDSLFFAQFGNYRPLMRLLKVISSPVQFGGILRQNSA